MRKLFIAGSSVIALLGGPAGAADLARPAPVYAVPQTVVVDTLFVRPTCCHYYFGDYYGPEPRRGFPEPVRAEPAKEETTSLMPDLAVM